MFSNNNLNRHFKEIYQKYSVKRLILYLERKNEPKIKSRGKCNVINKYNDLVAVLYSGVLLVSRKF